MWTALLILGLTYSNGPTGDAYEVRFALFRLGPQQVYEVKSFITELLNNAMDNSGVSFTDLAEAKKFVNDLQSLNSEGSGKILLDTISYREFRDNLVNAANIDELFHDNLIAPCENFIKNAQTYPDTSISQGLTNQDYSKLCQLLIKDELALKEATLSAV